MSGFDFPSAPGGNPIVDSVGAAASFQWSLNTLFGNDPTTVAIKKQTAMLAKQQHAENSMNIVNNIYNPCVDLVNKCVDLFVKSKRDMAREFSLEFLNEQHDSCVANLDIFYKNLVALISSGKFKAAGKYLDSNLSQVVDPLAEHAAFLETMYNLSVMMQLQIHDCAQVFHNSENLEAMRTAYHGRWDKLIEKYHVLRDIDASKSQLVEQDMDDLLPFLKSTSELFDNSFALLRDLKELTLSAWDGFKNGNNISESMTLEMASLMASIKENETKWLSQNEFALKSLEKIEEKLANVSLAIDITGIGTPNIGLSLKSKIQELDELFESKSITKAEYEKLRSKIIENYE